MQHLTSQPACRAGEAGVADGAGCLSRLGEDEPGQLVGKVDAYPPADAQDVAIDFDDRTDVQSEGPPIRGEGQHTSDVQGPPADGDAAEADDVSAAVTAIQGSTEAGYHSPASTPCEQVVGWPPDVEHLCAQYRRAVISNGRATRNR